VKWARIAAHELRLERRARETFIPVALTGLLVVTIGALSFHDVAERAAVASGTLWMGLAFASALGVARAFGSERDRGTLDTLLTLPVERGSLYLGKAVAHFALMLAAACVLVPAYLVASGEGAPTQWPGLALILVLGALGLAATGTLLSALAAQTRTRDLLLPVLLFPLLIPLLVSTIHASADLLADAPFAEWRGELLVLAGYDLAFLAASWLLFEAAVGA
jgi:heme exporter protein B